MRYTGGGASESSPGSPNASGRPRVSKCEVPSSKHREVEDPSPLLLRRAQSPPRPTLPRRPTAKTWTGTLRERNPLNAGLTGPGRAGKWGELIGANGKYVGEVLAGRPHGLGQYLVPKDGHPGEYVVQFDGQWIQGRREGRGVRLYARGESYTGDWVQGIRHGQGRYLFESGDVYAGSWVDDKRSGQGTYFYTNGDCFIGGFRRDRKEGMGTLYQMARQKKYVAEYVADVPKCGTVLDIEDPELEPLRGHLQTLALQHKLDALAAGTPIYKVPKCGLQQPSRVLAEQFVAVRRQREAGGGAARKLQAASGTLGQKQIEMLRHSFVLMAAGDGMDAGLRPHQLRDLTVMAGMDPKDESTWALVEQLLARKATGSSGNGKISFDNFLQVVVHFRASSAAALQPIQRDMPLEADDLAATRTGQATLREQQQQADQEQAQQMQMSRGTSSAAGVSRPDQSASEDDEGSVDTRPASSDDQREAAFPLVSGMQQLQAVMSAVHEGEEMLDEEDESDGRDEGEDCGDDQCDEGQETLVEDAWEGGENEEQAQDQGFDGEQGQQADEQGTDQFEFEGSFEEGQDNNAGTEHDVLDESDGGVVRGSSSSQSARGTAAEDEGGQIRQSNSGGEEGGELEAEAGMEVDVKQEGECAEQWDEGLEEGAAPAMDAMALPDGSEEAAVEAEEAC